MKKKPPRDPIAEFERETRAQRRVGLGNKCHACGEDRPLALIPSSDPTICAACQRRQNGRSEFDHHHPAGKANNPATVPVDTNDHRAVLSPQQYNWPKETFENPTGSPLRVSAANVRGYVETSEYFVAVLLIPLAEMDEALDSFLLKRLGPEWWVGTEMERFAAKPKRKR